MVLTLGQNLLLSLQKCAIRSQKWREETAKEGHFVSKNKIMLFDYTQCDSL